MCTACVHSMCTTRARRVLGMCAVHHTVHHNNAPLFFEPGGAAEGVLSEGDVLVSIDGVSCAEATLAQARHRACILHGNCVA